MSYANLFCAVWLGLFSVIFFIPNDKYFNFASGLCCGCAFLIVIDIIMEMVV